MIEREIPFSGVFSYCIIEQKNLFLLCVCGEREREREMINAELLVAQELTMEMKNQLKRIQVSLLCVA